MGIVTTPNPDESTIEQTSALMTRQLRKSGNDESTIEKTLQKHNFQNPQLTV